MNKLILFVCFSLIGLTLTAQPDNSHFSLQEGAGYFSDLLQYLEPSYNDIHLTLCPLRPCLPTGWFVG